MSCWDVIVPETEKNSLPLTVGMEMDVIPKFPSMSMLIGKSGSGKSSLLISMCLNSDLLGDFFDQIYFISPTAKVDDLVKNLKLPSENVWDNMKEAIKNLEILFDNQAYEIEKHGITKAAENNKVLVICDDVIGDKNFMKSDILGKMAIHGRHNLISSVICSQSYTKVPRYIRLQAQGLGIFPSNQDEVKLLNNDYCPANCSFKEFNKIIRFATDEPYSFLFINNHCKDMNKRFRKRLGHIINIDGF